MQQLKISDEESEEEESEDEEREEKIDKVAKFYQLKPGAEYAGPKSRKGKELAAKKRQESASFEDRLKKMDKGERIASAGSSLGNKVMTFKTKGKEEDGTRDAERRERMKEHLQERKRVARKVGKMPGSKGKMRFN